MLLTKHFVENWEKRVGNTPTVKCVKNIIHNSVRIQPFKEFTLVDGAKYKRLGIYWQPDLDIVISVDHLRGCAVSVLTPEVLNK